MGRQLKNKLQLTDTVRAVNMAGQHGRGGCVCLDRGARVLEGGMVWLAYGDRGNSLPSLTIWDVPKLLEAAARALSLEAGELSLRDHSSAGRERGLHDLPGQVPSRIVKLTPPRVSCGWPGASSSGPLCDSHSLHPIPAK